MKLSVGPIPLYSQLEQDLVGRIAAGFYPTGGCLPTEEQLGQQYGVSRITVRKALCALIARGLIVRRRGVGTFVVEQPRNVHAVHLGGSMDELLSSARLLSRRILSMESVRAPSEIAEAFGMQADDTVLRLELVRESEVGPVTYSVVFIRSDIQEQISLDDLRSGEPIIYVVSHKLGERIGWASQVIQSVLAGEVTGTHLGVSPDIPVLQTERKYFNSSGVLMEVELLHHHPEHHRYEVELLPRLYSARAPEPIPT